MKLKPIGTPGKTPKHLRAWTQQEDELLATLYPSHSAPEMTKHFQRTEHAIRGRIRLLLSQGVIHRKTKILNTEEISMLIKNRHAKTLQELANEVGCSRATVQLHLYKRGYRARKCGELHHRAKYSDQLAELVTELHDEHGMPFRAISRYLHELTGIRTAHNTAQRLYNRQTATDALLYELLPN
ncbi:TPA: DNA-binding protein [Escherichia coli]|uniref:DNA-binding protein n=1 Tax=Escherichia coli TaxID=562 RepID=UPI001C190DC2|nr:DNA-binding protein [Escherichia coli]EHM0703862.1 DNA-binding protein [Escherichia coli]EJT1785745.1 DNA-binding protein [Escherichia coli]EMC3022429.1 DNA-binding protein [Escherichia coli]HBE2841309.1 DNA-binding protein [Escherichia coli]